MVNKAEATVVEFEETGSEVVDSESNNRTGIQVTEPFGTAGKLESMDGRVANPSGKKSVQSGQKEIRRKLDYFLDKSKKAGTAAVAATINHLGGGSQGNLHHWGLAEVDPISFGSVEALTGAMVLIIVDYMKHDNRGSKISSGKKMSLWATEVAALLLGLDGVKHVLLTLSPQELDLFLKAALPTVFAIVGAFRSNVFDVLEEKNIEKKIKS